MTPRDGSTRKQDALTLLATPVLDAWVASASSAGPHLIPLSLAWIDERAVIAVQASSLTGRNIAASGRARLGVGATRDVVMIDAVLERTVEVGTDEMLGEAYAALADWDPRTDSGYVYLVLRPSRIQAWREADETVGRTLMRDGAWLV